MSPLYKREKRVQKGKVGEIISQFQKLHPDNILKYPDYCIPIRHLIGKGDLVITIVQFEKMTPVHFYKCLDLCSLIFKTIDSSGKMSVLCWGRGALYA